MIALDKLIVICKVTVVPCKFAASSDCEPLRSLIGSTSSDYVSGA